MTMDTNAPPAKGMLGWKVVKDDILGDLGPLPLDANEGHADNKIDWDSFHNWYPQFEYFT
jgi:hypothetical protein